MEVHSKINSINILVFFSLVFISLLSYRKAIQSDFIYDDNIRIAEVKVNNNALQFEIIPAYKDGLVKLIQRVLPDRPLLMATLWINYKFFGDNPSGYKITNILLHAIAAFFFFILLQKLQIFFELPESLYFRILLAFIFLLHPIQNQAVTIVVQRGAILSTIFAILSISSALDYLQYEKRDYLFKTCFFFFLGILCKENILLVPIILFFLARFTKNKEGARRLFFTTAPAMALPVIFYFILKDNFHKGSENAGTWMNYGLVQSKVIFHYLGQVFFLTGFNSTYPISTSANLFKDFTWAYLLTHILLLFSAARLYLQKIKLGLFILLFYLALAPESSVFPIPHVVFDHRMYFPMVFLCASFILLDLSKMKMIQRRVIHLFFFICCILLFFANHQRTVEVSNYKNWIKNSALKYKSDHGANINLLSFLLQLKDFEEGNAISSDFMSLYPGVLDYEVFHEIFIANSDERNSSIYRALYDERNKNISNTTRNTLIAYLDEEIQKSVPVKGVLWGLEESYLLLDNQKQYFSQMRFNTSMAETYYKNQFLLHREYSYLDKKGLLTHGQRQIWLGFLSEFYLRENSSEKRMLTVSSMSDFTKYIFWKNFLY